MAATKFVTGAPLAAASLLAALALAPAALAQTRRSN
jgi:hypothetical protein